MPRSSSTAEKPKHGVLLINLGTPDAPDPDSVRTYLREFLMDPYVIDIAAPLRWVLVNLMILPKRSHASAKLYQKIWSSQGSPLRYFHQSLVEKCRKQLGPEYEVQGAMRYGKPSIAGALREFSRMKLEKVWVVPLYPQYSLAATESSVVEVRQEAKRLGCEFELEFAEAFYDRPEYAEVWAERIQEFWSPEKYDKLILSFHGLPERQVKKLDPTHQHCLKSDDCCAKIVDANRNCYRAQSYATARAIAKRLGIKKDDYEVSFQSRLGRTPWIRPYTDELYETLPSKGVKRIAVACPSFVADCLETLEEVGLRGKEQFVQAGGKKLTAIPSLNAEKSWVKALCGWIEKDLRSKPGTKRTKASTSTKLPT